MNGKVGEIVDKTVNETAGYAIVQQDFGILSLNGGVRYEHSSAYGGEWVPQAGFSIRPMKGNVIKGSFSKGYRSPTLRELYISYLPYSKANPDLNPESMLNYELSVGQYFMDNRLHAKTDWSIGYAYANKNQPDRRIIDREENGFVGDAHKGEMRIDQNEIERMFYRLDEHIVSASFNHQRNLSIGNVTPSLKIGAYAEYRARIYTLSPAAQEGHPGTGRA